MLSKKSINCVFLLFQSKFRALKTVGHDYKIQFSTKQGDCDHETYTWKDVIKQDVSYATEYYGPCHLTIIASYKINVFTCETNK